MGIDRRNFLMGSLATAVVGGLAGCSSGATSTPGNTTGTGGTAEEKVTFQAGYENNPGEPIDEAMNHWAELLAERSGGSMTMEIFPSSQLGSKSDLIDQMLAGSPVITLADGAFYADRGVPDFGIVFGPYLFDSWDDCWRLTKSDWYADQSAKLEEEGLKLITSNWKYGDRHTLLTREISSVDGLQGMKVRVPNNVIQIKGFEAMGATPTPMSLGEVYTSLQQGTIDGLENPLPVLANGKFQEVAKNLILTGHVKNFTTWLTGADTFNSLSDEQKRILQETGDEAGVFNNDLQDAVYEETLEAMKADGVKVLDLDLEGFKAKAMSFYEMPEITSLWSDGLYETVKEAMK